MPRYAPSLSANSGVKLTADSVIDRNPSNPVRSILRLRGRPDLLCTSDYCRELRSFADLALYVALRYLQGCLHRPGRGYVPHGLTHHCARQRESP